MSAQRELIMKAAGEGGSVSLWGERTGEGFHFYREQKESVLADLLDEGDEGLIDRLHQSSFLSDDIAEALHKMGSFWPRLVPRFVHPEFAATVWGYVRNRTDSVRSWEKICFDGNVYIAAAQCITNAAYLVVLTGAGCSVDSGVPDFRSPSGWWNKIDPRTVASIEALEDDYDLFHEFYKTRILHLKEITPHQGHSVLSRWEAEGRMQFIATQNVDGLHQAAGNKKVEELHGTIRAFHCHSCSKIMSEEAFLAKRSCPHCSGRIRPSVVLFGEALPESAWNRSLQEIAKADLVIVIGTSLQVSPVNRLPFLTDGKTMLINMEATGGDTTFDYFIQGRAAEKLLKIDEAMRLL